MKVIDYLSSQLNQLGVPQPFYWKIMNKCIENMDKHKIIWKSTHGNIEYQFEVLYNLRLEQKILKHKIDIYEVNTINSIVGNSIVGVGEK